MELKLTFNEAVLNYDKFRPTYVPELFEEIIEYTHLNDNKKALEIGIGTGQATLPFLKTNCHLTAIEIGDSLAQFSKQKFAYFKNFDVINTEFESFNSPDNEFDLVYSATAFHWIADEVGYPKVLNLLRQGGTLALFWNHPTPNKDNDELQEEIQKSYKKYRPNAKTPVPFDESQCQIIIDKLNKYGFKNVTKKLFYQTRTLNAEQYINLLNTYSDHIAMDKEKKQEHEINIANAINKFGGEIKIYDIIDLYLAKKS